MKEKIVRNTIVAGAVAAGIGFTQPNYPAVQAVMYGGTTAAIAALASVYYYDPDKELDEARKKTEQLAKSLDQVGHPQLETRGTPVASGGATKGFQNVPEKYRGIFTPGEWTLFAIDEWEQLDDNHLVHKTEMMELKPAQINQK